MKVYEEDDRDWEVDLGSEIKQIKKLKVF